MRTNRQEAQAQMQKAQDQMTKLQSQFSMLLQTTISAMIAQVRTPDNYHSNESESTSSESYSAQTTSNWVVPDFLGND